MLSRRPAPLAALSIALLGLAVSAAAQEEAVLTRLEVLLTTSPNLSDAAQTSMMREAAAIWRRQGVWLEWLPPTTIRALSSDRLRVLVVDQRPPDAGSQVQFSVGELIRPSGSHALALVSIESARRLVSSLRGRAGYELIAVDERRLGLVLGRAMAHEIGHYLLDTATHARIGLMRPHFDALEFTDLRHDAFVLDAAAAAWLHRRDAGRFTYVSSVAN